MSGVNTRGAVGGVLLADSPFSELVTGLEARARAATTVAELGFSVANDSYGLLRFRQALVLDGDGPRAALLTVSGLARPTEDSPYLIWLRRAWPWMHQQLHDKPGWLPQPGADMPGLPPGLLDGWLEWWPAGALYCPSRGALVSDWAGWCFCWITPHSPCKPMRFSGFFRPGATAGRCWQADPSSLGKSAGIRWKKTASVC